MSDAEDIIHMIKELIRPDEQRETHVRIETLGCGEIVVPLSHVTLHKVGGTCRMLVRDDLDWREISSQTYQMLMGLIDYA